MGSNTTLDGDAIGAVERLSKQAFTLQTAEVGGVAHYDRPLYDARKPAQQPTTINLSTLGSLIEFVKADQDAAWVRERSAFIHVRSPLEVALVTGVFGDFAQRADIAVAKAIVPPFKFGQFMSTEDFVISVISAFEDCSDRAELLKIAGNVKEEAVRTVADDGVSQQVVASNGIARVGNVVVPSSYRLSAWRTFREVGSIYGEFALRMRGGGNGELPTAALFPCDGGQWQLTATEMVRDHLADKLSGNTIRIYA